MFDQDAPEATGDFLDSLDLEAFAEELDALRDRAKRSLGPEDAAHLTKMERWGRTCSTLGYATAWIAPNPLSAALLSTGRITRWAMVGHHVTHRGYDRVPGVPKTRHSKVFAKGWRRLVDWFDWIEPEAWNTEHNLLHHYRLGEEADPDLVERNLEFLRGANVPRWTKRALVAIMATGWKFGYYAPNARYEHQNAMARRRGDAPVYANVHNTLRDPALWLKALMPYFLGTFVVVPALFAPLGPWAVASVALNSVAAEALTNLHGFVVIVPNHVGDDIYRFEGTTEGRADFYLRQILGSTNFRTGGDLNDFLHGYLNYQIEHHLYPDLPMTALRRVQPEVKAICEKHGVPYVQESVFTRLKKTVAVMVGDADMRRDARLDRGPERAPTLEHAAA